MKSSKFLTRISTIAIILMLALGNVIPAYAVGTNDNFANATQITSLPFSANADTYGATMEGGEPYPCNYGYPPNSVWYSYTPSSNVTLTARANYYYAVLAIYTGPSVDSLSQVSCSNYYPQVTLQFQANTTYYFQLSTLWGGYNGEASSNIPFSLEVPPPPQVYINQWPYDPTIFDIVSFGAGVNDPAGIYGNTYAWTISDGTTSNQPNFTHQFVADGDYNVNLTFTTYDERTGSATQVVHVLTRDIAINKFSIPQTAKVNTTKAISVDVTNKRYSDNVQVQLFKGLPGGGEQLIGTLTIYVPARAKRPTTFNFSYTFTSADAAVGKATFRTVATLVSGRDALPADNTAIGTTLVTGGASYP